MAFWNELKSKTVSAQGPKRTISYQTEAWVVIEVVFRNPGWGRDSESRSRSRVTGDGIKFRDEFQGWGKVLEQELWLGFKTGVEVVFRGRVQDGVRSGFGMGGQGWVLGSSFGLRVGVRIGVRVGFSDGGRGWVLRRGSRSSFGVGFEFGFQNGGLRAGVGIVFQDSGRSHVFGSMSDFGVGVGFWDRDVTVLGLGSRSRSGPGFMTWVEVGPATRNLTLTSIPRHV
ncbi:hypothetical protein TIFTF001_008817 [Ficus carica]|uniref:Uncharacterized protein n=1 Tax=Ficus carica TaxID=3494 RepID=A0AA88A9D9_FICCA|nr:hypothetical protein TIFTF001_008817 [Ficus carica]